jgi:hypothetical protein
MRLKGEMFVIETNVFKLTVGMVLTLPLGFLHSMEHSKEITK